MAQFRRETTASATSEKKKTGGRRQYEAYDKQGKPSPYTEIHCIMQPSQSPQSRFLLSTIYSADVDEAFTLIYSFLAVEIKGRNLKEVRRAIQSGRCEFIQEYHENEFLPIAQGQPVIESIKFIASGKLDDLLASQKGRGNE